jgi:hypothetical protein
LPRTTLCLGIGAAPGGPSGVVPGAPLELRVWSRSGLTGFVLLRAAAGVSPQTLPVGRFDGNARADHRHSIMQPTK